jgi:hypothetical protein|tara:strand:+ start:1260 stop:1376 length:117 start_codon:yes stop_codon:yes gene_type:complete
VSAENPVEDELHVVLLGTTEKLSDDMFVVLAEAGRSIE